MSVMTISHPVKELIILAEGSRVTGKLRAALG